MAGNNSQPKKGTIKRRKLEHPKSHTSAKLLPTKKIRKKKPVTISNNKALKVRPLAVHKARKKLTRSSNNARKLRIKAIRGDMITKGKLNYYYSNSNNSNNKNSYYQSLPQTKINKKISKHYKFKNKIPIKKNKFRLTNKHNRHGLTYMETSTLNKEPFILPPKKTVTKKSTLGK